MDNLADVIDVAPRPGSQPMFVCYDKRIRVFTQELFDAGARDMFTTMANLWREAFPNIRPQANPALPWLPVMVLWHEQTTMPSPSGFPCVVVQELDGSTLDRTMDSGRTERHRTILWQIDTFSNVVPGAGMQAKTLQDFIHPIMEMYGWRRTTNSVAQSDSLNITRMRSDYRIVLDQYGIASQR